jgi:hypothetical protein
MERCGKSNAVYSGSESWTGIGVVAGFGADVRILQGSPEKRIDVRWKIQLLYILQEVRSIYKTRNRFIL